MFRLHKNRSGAKSGDKLHFTFSHFNILQVPKGWDKLYVFLISVENGKTISKLGRGTVRNGSCQWTETLSESLLITQLGSSKEPEECLLKFVVAMGSSRSSVLGEATVNMAAYMSSSASIPLSFPLRKCVHGTVLQVKVQCLTPRMKLRDGELKETNSFIEDPSANNPDVSIRSDKTDCTFPPSVESQSNSPPNEYPSRETSFSASGSFCSYESVEGSTGSNNYSPKINLRDERGSQITAQDSISSLKSVSCDYPADDSSQSNHSSFNSQPRAVESKIRREDEAKSSPKTSPSSKRLDTAEDTIEEIRAEAKMWERNARKLMLDLNISRAKFSAQSKNLADLETKLSTAYLERDNLKKEVEELKLLFEEDMAKHEAQDDLPFQDVCAQKVEKELKDELKFQKESNANLALQLKRSQESNIELVSILQELEETIEKQRTEIENLSTLSSKSSDAEHSFRRIMEDNKNLMLQLQQLEDSEKNLLVKVQQLEEALEEKKRGMESESNLNHQIYMDIGTEYQSKLYIKEKDILNFKEKLSVSQQERLSAEKGPMDGMMREIEILQEKVIELERDCNELTDENLELLFKLKEANKIHKEGGSSHAFSPSKLSAKCFSGSVTEGRIHFEAMVGQSLAAKTEINGNCSSQENAILEKGLETRVTELTEEVTNKSSEITYLEANLLSKEKEIGILKKHQNELEAAVSNLQNEKIQLKKKLAVMQKEREITSRCQLPNDAAVMNGSMGSHSHINKALESKILDLEREKQELELLMSVIEQEKVQVSASMSVLETQMKYLTDEKETIHLELKSSKSHTKDLQEEISKLTFQMDSEKDDLKQKLKHAELQLVGAEHEYEQLRRTYLQLQSNEDLTSERNHLQKSNEELQKQKQDLLGYCSLLESRLKASEQKFSDFSKRVAILEKNLSLLEDDVASNEKILTSELDSLLEADRKHEENLIQSEILIKKMEMEKVVEIQKLQEEINHLTKKLSDTNNEKEKIASSSVHEVSSLQAENSKLEYALKETQSKVILSENEINALRMEYELKLQDIMCEHEAMEMKQKTLIADRERLLKLVENYESKESKVKTALHELETKLSASEHEKKQLKEECRHFKAQIQRIDNLQDEVVALNTELESITLEREKLETSLRIVSEECEDLKAEKNSLGDKISILQYTVFELENNKRSTVALEEKIHQMKSVLVAREASLVQEADLKNELSQLKRVNQKFQQTIKLLEEEKVECLRQAHSFEEELKLTKQQLQKSMSRMNSKTLPPHEDIRLSKNHIAKNISSRRNNKRWPSLKNDKELVKDQDPYCNKNQIEVKHPVDGSYDVFDEHLQTVGLDHVSKTQLLPSEPTKATEAKKIHEVRVNRPLSHGQNSEDVPLKSTAEGEVVTKEIFENTKLVLEAELRDIRERYLHMSLKYAEAEAQRQELVLKIKEAKNAKRWFS